MTLRKGLRARRTSWMLTHPTGPLLFTSARDSAHVGLTGLQGDQSFVASIGDADNSLSMSWVKVGSNGAMNHAGAVGGSWHPTVTTLGGGVE
ncbi:hypothetical protein EMIT053CA3_200084 [Pseudomonas donghuensis]